MHPVPLNIFQRTQRHWDTLHPYNAGQAMVLDRSFSTQTLEDAFNLALQDLRLGTFVCVDNRYWIDRANPFHAQVVETDDIEAHLSREMNRPFDPLVSLPFRPFVHNAAGEQTVGVIYQHWVADSVAIRSVMRAWLSRLLDLPALRPAPVQLDSLGTFGRFSPETHDWSVLSNLIEQFPFTRAMKRVRRVESPQSDQSVATIIRALPPGSADRLRSRARALHATVGDLLLASSAIACANLGPNHATIRRPDLAMGTIVDLRARAPHLSDRVFSLFLGFMISPFTAADLRSVDRAVARARAVRLRHSRHRSAEASQLRLWIGLQLAKRLRPHNLLNFYRKRLPLSGGLSNVNLTPTWSNLHPTPVRRYHRISPTGPMMPLVLTPTTLGGEVSVCCSYKPAVINADATAQIVDAIIQTTTRDGSEAVGPDRAAADDAQSL